MTRSGTTAWLQLLRLPNVFTAVADVMMGYLVTHGDLEPWWQFGMLAAASALLYLSGMVLNDIFDAEVDARERPERPIPSGRVSVRAARILGWTLLLSGVLMGWLVPPPDLPDYWPGLIATFLAAAVVIYDWALKRTPVAPLAMGACRFLNVLLGMSLTYPHGVPVGEHLSRRPWFLNEWLIAIGVGLYVMGVTVFARTEARETPRSRLTGGLIVLMSGMALLAAVPALTDYQPRLIVRNDGWYLLWVVLALITARRCVLAIMRPEPRQVQLAVRHCVHSIIVLDAAVCVGYAGPYWGFAVLSLLFPTLLLTMWLNAT